ncbi:uncharacterized protein [Physcomitrium patens]|uniref:uncharacterized protein n=1 Tax=Physcomitrium patens TaxID=3218 RepID=UPI000D154CFD|nr:uncharacterized protein LOC112278313 isoform X2 [Physcomitrium patens]|eukprot:XP_024367354.1 uncharacterized protein LOC112278313 isoform X2 [Physcomitrella patens]
MSQNQATIPNFDILRAQKIEVTEVKSGIELYQFRSGPEDASDTAASASAAEKRESQDDIICFDLPCTQNTFPLERRELQSTNVEEESERLSPTLEYVSALAHLTTFGILGVCIRHGLELLFSGIANVTSENSPLFIDLPANMLGCFFMGWVGVSLKKEIANFSELLAIGLSTGLMGSITTYASWNQAMIFLVTKGFWVRSIVSLIIGMEMSQMSLLVGIDSATFLKSGLMHPKRVRIRRGWQKHWNSSPETLHRRKAGMLVFLAISIILWAACLVLTVTDVNSYVRRRLWLACMVGPPGVWSRWLLARLNGQGIGRNHHLKWLPIGTLLTNLIASTLEAVLAVVILVVCIDCKTVITKFVCLPRRVVNL